MLIYPLTMLIVLLKPPTDLSHTLPLLERNSKVCFIRENMLLATVLDSFCVDNFVQVCRSQIVFGKLMGALTFLLQDFPQMAIHIFFLFEEEVEHASEPAAWEEYRGDLTFSSHPAPTFSSHPKPTFSSQLFAHEEDHGGGVGHHLRRLAGSGALHVPHADITVKMSLICSAFAICISFFNMTMFKANMFDPVLLQIELKQRREDKAKE